VPDKTLKSQLQASTDKETRYEYMNINNKITHGKTSHTLHYEIHGLLTLNTNVLFVLSK